MSTGKRQIIAWSAAIVYIGAIFAVIPVAPALWKKVVDKCGTGGAFLIGAVLLAAIMCCLAGYAAYARRAAHPITYIGLASVAILTFSLYSRFEVEAFAERSHFIEYGILSPLILAAVRSPGRISGYLWALMLSWIIGALDEFYQGMIPVRVFGVEDMLLNAIGSCLGLAAIAVIPEKDKDEI